MQAAEQNTPATPARYSGWRHCTRQRLHMGVQAAWRTVPSGDCALAHRHTHMCDGLRSVRKEPYTKKQTKLLAATKAVVGGGLIHWCNTRTIRTREKRLV